MEEDPIKNILDFSYLINRLKYVYRLSATHSKQKDSSAAHSWRVAVMAYAYQKQFNLDLDIKKAIKIALFHDIAEAVTGDVDYRLIMEGKASKEDKNDAEIKAMTQITKELPKEMSKEINELWQEYETGSSKEARFIKALDKIEAISNHIERGPDIFDHKEIIVDYADKAVQNFLELKPVLRSLKQQLKIKFLELKIPWESKYNYALD